MPGQRYPSQVNRPNRHYKKPRMLRLTEGEAAFLQRRKATSGRSVNDQIRDLIRQEMNRTPLA